MKHSKQILKYVSEHRYHVVLLLILNMHVCFVATTSEHRLYQYKLKSQCFPPSTFAALGYCP